MEKKDSSVRITGVKIQRRPCLAFLVADGFQDTELFGTYDLCKQGGLNCFLVSADNLEDVKSSAGITVKVDNQLSLLSITDFDGLVVPGGAIGVQNLLKYEEVSRLIKVFEQKQKLIAAICAGPVVLAKAGVLQKKRFTCFPSDAVIKYCLNKGGIYVADKKVIRDQQLITSKSPRTVQFFGRAIVNYFNLEIKR